MIGLYIEDIKISRTRNEAALRGRFFNASAARYALRLYFWAYFRAICSEPINYTSRAAPLKIAGKYRASRTSRTASSQPEPHRQPLRVGACAHIRALRVSRCRWARVGVVGVVLRPAVGVFLIAALPPGGDRCGDCSPVPRRLLAAELYAF